MHQKTISFNLRTKLSFILHLVFLRKTSFHLETLLILFLLQALLLNEEVVQSDKDACNSRCVKGFIMHDDSVLREAAL